MKPKTLQELIKYVASSVDAKAGAKSYGINNMYQDKNGKMTIERDSPFFKQPGIAKTDSHKVNTVPINDHQKIIIQIPLQHPVAPYGGYRPKKA